MKEHPPAEVRRSGAGLRLPRLTRRLAVLAAALLPGCAGLEQRPPPAAALATGPGEAAEREAAQAPQGLAPWWLALGDPGLDRAIRGALADHPRLDELAARVTAARELARAEGAAAAPAAAAEAGWRRGREKGPGTGFREAEVHPWAVAGVLSWELDLFGRVAARRASARADAEAEAARLLGARLALSAEIAAARLTQLRLHEELLLTREILAASEETDEAVARRKEAGLASAAETLRQQAETESLRRAALEIDRQRQVAAVRADVIAGRPPGDTAPPKESLTRQIRVPALPASLPLARVGQRPDLLAAAREVKGRHAAEQAARLELYPSLRLRLDGMASAGSLAGPFQEWLAAGGPALSVPALDPAARSRARAARSGTDAAAARWEQAVLVALGEAESAWIDYRSRREQLASARREAEALDTAWEQTRTTFAAGAASHLETLEDQRRRLAARSAVLALHHAALLDYITLVKALGGSLGEE